MTATRRRARPRTRAALRPAAPPPTTTTSYSVAAMAITSAPNSPARRGLRQVLLPFSGTGQGADLVPARPAGTVSEPAGRMALMTVTGRDELVALDAADIETLASFYAELTGWEITRRESDWITMRASDGQEVAFQLAPDHIAPQWPGQELPQQVHLDLQTDDHQAAAERAVALGAKRL